MLFALLLVISVTDRAFPEEKDETVLIHVKSLAGNSELRLRSITGTCLEALKRGHKVIVLFDVESVKAIKIGSWYGGDTTLLDKIDLMDDERKKLSHDLEISIASIPSNYGELFRLLRGKGVELYASKTMMNAFGIGEDDYDLTVIPVDIDKIVDMITRAVVYVSY